MTKPVIFLAFANDRTAGDLRSLADELRGIRAALSEGAAAGRWELVERADTSVDDLLSVFRDARYRGRIAVLHYGGHAGSNILQLEGNRGDAEPAHAGGLAAFLGMQAGLKLVVLNGCSTRAQADLLLSAGIPAVITTACAIEDSVAMRFATGFYTELAGGETVSRAFAKAGEAVRLRVDDPRKAYRGAVVDDGDDVWPWDLRYADAAQRVAGWQLAEGGLVAAMRTRAALGYGAAVAALALGGVLLWSSAARPHSGASFAVVPSERPSIADSLSPAVVYPSPLSPVVKPDSPPAPPAAGASVRKPTMVYFESLLTVHYNFRREGQNHQVVTAVVPYRDSVDAGATMPGVPEPDGPTIIDGTLPVLTLVAENPSSAAIALTQAVFRVVRSTADRTPLLLSLVNPYHKGIHFVNEGWGAVRSPHLVITGWSAARDKDVSTCPRATSYTAAHDSLTLEPFEESQDVNIDQYVPATYKGSRAVCVFARLEYSDAENRRRTTSFATLLPLQVGLGSAGGPLTPPSEYDLRMRVGKSDTTYDVNLPDEDIGPRATKHITIKPYTDSSGTFEMQTSLLTAGRATLPAQQIRLSMFIPRSWKVLYDLAATRHR